MSETAENKSFWEHLEDLRGSLIRILIAAFVFSTLAFCFKDLLFRIVLAPKDSSFFMYRLFGGGDFSIQLMNTGLTEQFMIHLKTACAFGILMASPYIIYVLFDFVRPALYEKAHAPGVEMRRYAGFAPLFANVTPFGSIPGTEFVATRLAVMRTRTVVVELE